MKEWKAQTDDGRWFNEGEIPWEVIQPNVTHLEFNNNGQRLVLPKAESYLQGKSASADMATGKCSIESRFLGAIIGNTIVKIRINEVSNNISVEIEHVKPNNSICSSNIT